MDERGKEASERLWRERARQYAPVVGLYLLLTWLTGSNYMGDTVDYVAAIQAYANGQPPSPINPFWEFGHLLWRPLGWLLSQVASPWTRAVAGADERANILYTLIALNRFSGLLCVVLLRSLLMRFCRTRWAAEAAVAGFILTQAFLNYFHTGCSYVPGLALLLLGLRLLAREAANSSVWLTGTLVGLSFAGAVGLWFLYVLALPAALVFPLLLLGVSTERWRLLLIVTLVAGLAGALMYGAVMFHLEIDTLAELKSWVAGASHGLLLGGVSRMIYGFARSFIDLGNYGVALKRFLLHDPYHPVSLVELFRASLWKLMLFYFFLAAMLFNLWRAERGRQLLLLLVAGGLPVIGFACFWSGTVTERYLPLFPFLFLALAVTLERAGRAFKLLALVFVVAVAFTNFGILSRWQLARQEAAGERRTSDLRAASLPETPYSMVIVVQDNDLRHFGRDFPFNPVNRKLGFYTAALLGSDDAPVWRQNLAKKVFKVWGEGGAVWFSRRLLSAMPRAEWDWIEGSDQSVAWTDFPAFFSQLETVRAVGGDDGFLLVPPSPWNRQFLGGFADERP